MARVSKPYRRLLMSRANQNIWRTARRNAGWQDLQSGEIGELEYALYIARVCTVRSRSPSAYQLANGTVAGH